MCDSIYLMVAPLKSMMFNRVHILCLFLLISTLLCAQVGFGTNDSHPSSIVDFATDDKGILIPRVTLTDLTNPKIKPLDARSPSAAKSLLIYNKTEQEGNVASGKTAIAKGFYYWDGTKWTKLGDPPTSSPRFLRMNKDFQLDKSHRNATIKVDGKRKITIPSDLPEGFKVTLIGDESEPVSIFSQAPIFNQSPVIQLIKNGVARMIFHKENNNPIVRIWGDLAQHEAFVTKWQVSAGERLEIRMNLRDVSSGNYDYEIDWGDGQKQRNGRRDRRLRHTYNQAGTYFVAISGKFPRFLRPSSGVGISKLKELANWGKIKWGRTFTQAFSGASGMKVTAHDVPDLRLVRDTDFMFNECSSITTIPNIESWDVSNVIRMRRMFRGVTNFNQDISRWNPNITSSGNCTEYLRGTSMSDDNMISKFKTSAPSCNRR